MERKNYAIGKAIESATGYVVKVGDPIVDAEAVAGEQGIVIPCPIEPNGEYLVSLEVNGTVIASRETIVFSDEGTAKVGSYTLVYDDQGGAIVDEEFSEDDVVRLKIEPLEVHVTDGFRAAVGKAGGNAGGGSSGGAYLVHYDIITGALDKTWNEINAALALGIVEIVMASDEEFGTTVEYVRETGHNKVSGYYVEGANATFYADDPDDYPVNQASEE